MGKTSRIIKLSPPAREAIEEIVNRGCHAEVGILNGKLCVWENRSKTKYEQPTA